MSTNPNFEAIVNQAFVSAGLPEIAKEDLEIGTYTNAEMIEKMKDNPTKLLSLLAGVAEVSDVASKRSILSFAIEM